MSSTIATPQRRWTKKRIMLLVVVPLLVIALAAAGWALYILHAGVGGTLQSKSMTAKWTAVENFTGTSNNWLTANGSTATGEGWNGDMTSGAPQAALTSSVCTATLNSDGTLSVDAEGYPGDTCAIYGAVRLASGTDTARITGLDLSLPNGWKAAIFPGSACGANVTATSTSTSGSTSVPGTQVGIVFQIGTGSTTLSAANGGLSLSPSAQVTTQPSCPTISGAAS